MLVNSKAVQQAGAKRSSIPNDVRRAVPAHQKASSAAMVRRARYGSGSLSLSDARQHQGTMGNRALVGNSAIPVSYPQPSRSAVVRRAGDEHQSGPGIAAARESVDAGLNKDLKKLAKEKIDPMKAELVRVFERELAVKKTPSIKDRVDDRKSKRDFRKAAKEGAREGLEAAIAEQQSDDESPATKRYAQLRATDKLYRDVKPQANLALSEMARNQADEVLRDLEAEDKLYRAGEGKIRTWKDALIAVEDERKRLIIEAVKMAKERAISIRKDPYKKYRIKELAKTRAKEHADTQEFQSKIDADTPEAGFHKFGKILDGAIPTAGDAVNFSVQLKIRLGTTPGSIFIKLEGSAMRGVPGVMTAGYAQAADPSKNPRHLDISTAVSIGGGVDIPKIIEASIAAKFFLRAGAKDTQSTIDALVYAFNRATPKLKKVLPKSSGRASRTEMAEAKAAMVEEQVFDKDENAYADVGGGVGVSASALGGNLSGGVSFSHFKRYNKASLQDSLGSGPDDDFAKPVKGKDAAKRRKKKAKGATGNALSFSISGSIPPGIGISLSGSFSIPSSDAEGFKEKFKETSKKISENFGIEIDINMPSAKLEMIIRWTISAAKFIVDKLEAILRASKKDASKLEASVEAADAVHRAWADVQNMLPTTLQEQLGDNLSFGQSFTIAVFFGRSSGATNFRIELRESVGGNVEIPLGAVSLGLGYEKSMRLGMVGREGEDEMKWVGDLPRPR